MPQKLTSVVVLAGAVSLAACAGTPPITQTSHAEVCASVGLTGSGYRNRANEARTEVARRNLVYPGEWYVIDNKLVFPGMTECAALAVLGLPRSMSPRQYVFGGHNYLNYTSPVTSMTGAFLYGMRRGYTVEYRTFDIVTQSGRVTSCYKHPPDGSPAQPCTSATRAL